MSKCVLCNKKGLFLRVNSDGLCATCEKIKQEQEALRLQEEERQKEIERQKRREEFLKRKLIEAQEELDNIPLRTISISTEKRNRQKSYEGVKTSNITPKGKYSEFVVFDTETTGLAPFKDRIVELAAIRFVDGVAIERFETLVNPEKAIPAEVTKVNHITDDMVQSAPTISQVLPAFEAFVGNSPLIAHNLDFDLKFLFYSGCSVIEGKRKFYDTLEQSKKMLKKPKDDEDFDYDVIDYKLITLCEYYNITIPYQHRAAADALATGKLFLELVAEKQS